MCDEDCDVCGICFEGRGHRDAGLIRPCECSRLVHSACLFEWIKSCMENGRNIDTCDVCKHEWGIVRVFQLIMNDMLSTLTNNLAWNYFCVASEMYAFLKGIHPDIEELTAQHLVKERCSVEDGVFVFATNKGILSVKTVRERRENASVVNIGKCITLSNPQPSGFVLL